MKLRHLFLILAVLLIALAVGVILLCYENHTEQTYLIGAYILCILLFLIFFYRKAIRPFQSINVGINLLKEQDFNSRIARTGQYENDQIVEVFNRMMLQLKNERLHTLEQNHFLDLLINASPMGVIILNFDGQMTLINEAALKFLQLPDSNDCILKPFDQIETPLAQQIMTMSPESTRTIQLSNSTIYKCSRLSFIDRGFKHPFILIESLTEEVMKAEKEAYEKVIRMIAHEVNNTMAGITSTLDTVSDVMESMEHTDDLREVMRVCIERGLSLSSFITHFADVVKIPEPEPVRRNLNEVVTTCKDFMESICSSKGIPVTLDLCEGAPIVSIDSILFEQVMVNIIKNATESIEGQGCITIRTTLTPLMIEISDNGKEISKEVENKLFTPFFTTKPQGQGIGLLFIREVLTKHRCTFSLRTYDDHITRFQIIFPKVV